MRSLLMQPPVVSTTYMNSSFCVEANFVCEVEALGSDVKLAVFIPRYVTVRQIGAQRVHPVFNASRHRNPDPF
jgi:hypothetical protein